MRPLKVYLYREGIARFSSDKYDTSTLKNIFSHLTNTSINKLAANQNIMGGSTFGSGIKWKFEQLKALFKVTILSIISFSLCIDSIITLIN
jgi:tubulin polyglutamylase TTLL2